MTIDEVIQEYKEEAEEQRKVAKSLKAEEYLFYAEKNEQIAEWLEELKALRENKWTLIYQKRGYNKAIDDFANLISQKSHIDLDEDYVDGGSTIITTREVFEIAEQLKLKHLEKESEE